MGSVGSAKAAGFSDVNASHPFYEHMTYLFNEGIIQGFENNRFAPDRQVTRGDAALMIARTLDLRTAKRDTSFSDVTKQSAASGAIQSASELGIINGYTDGTFRPDERVNRSQMASLLARAFKLVDEEALLFNDVPVSADAYSDIRKVIAFGVTEGYSDGTFRPTTSLTRAQFSAFLARATNDTFRLKVFACGYNPESRVNPDSQTMNCLLTKAARQSEAQIPPEILKSVASIESNWKQFDENGKPVISADNGIGLMQITDTYGFDVERLKYDVAYNIEAGIEFLVKNFKRSDLPKFVNHNPAYLEHWYFAVMAYNGTKPLNSPFYKATGKPNPTAYQEKVYRKLSKAGLQQTNIKAINMSVDDFHYNVDSDKNIQFKKKVFNLSENATTSTGLVKAGDKVTYAGSGMRTEPNTGSELKPTSSVDKFTIIGEPVYDTQANSTNQFVWYPVRTVTNGKKQSGFIASPYIR